jgi:hypothetical protein
VSEGVLTRQNRHIIKGQLKEMSQKGMPGLVVGGRTPLLWCCPYCTHPNINRSSGQGTIVFYQFFRFDFQRSNSMPLPLLPALAAFALGRSTKKNPKRQAVSKYRKSDGTKVKAYTRKGK